MVCVIRTHAPLEFLFNSEIILNISHLSILFLEQPSKHKKLLDAPIMVNQILTIGQNALYFQNWQFTHLKDIIFFQLRKLGRAVECTSLENWRR